MSSGSVCRCKKSTRFARRRSEWFVRDGNILWTTMNCLLFPKGSVIHIVKSVLFIIQVVLMKSTEKQWFHQFHCRPARPSAEVHHCSLVFVHRVYYFDNLNELEKRLVLFLYFSSQVQFEIDIEKSSTIFHRPWRNGNKRTKKNVECNQLSNWCSTENGQSWMEWTFWIVCIEE